MGKADSAVTCQSARRERSQRTGTQSWLDRYNNSWYPEYTALALSSACVIAIVILLRYYNSKPSPKIAGLTLNAVIATLGTASKALLIYATSNALGQLKWVWFNGQNPRSLLDAKRYDDASRGPLGALQMLLASTNRSLASIGALLIILALAFDPFIQLVIDYETSVQFIDSNQAMMYSAGLYEVWGFDTFAEFTVNGAYYWDDYTWQASSCATASCTWANYTTLAWEHNCYEDRNWTLSTNCNFTTVLGQITNTSIQRDCSLSRSDPAFPTALSYINQSAEVTFNLYQWPTEAVMNFTTTSDWSTITYAAASAWSRYGPEFNHTEMTSPYMMVNTFSLSMNPNWTMVLNKSTTCELDLFIHEYDLESAGTSINATLKTKTPLRKFVSQVGTETDGTYNIFICFVPDSLSNTTWFSPRAEWFAHGDSNVYSHGINPSNKTQYCVSYMDGLPYWTDVIGQTIIGQSTSNYFIPNLTTTENASPNMLERWLGKNYTSLDISPYLTGLESSGATFDVWHYNGSERVIRNLAASMTKIGLDPSRNVNGTDPIYGQIGESFNLVRVRWLWLILPYGLCITATLFLLLTVYLSRRSAAPLWKSSVNALFYHGIDYDYGTFEKLSTIPEMDDQAARTRALLKPAGAYNKLMLETTVERNKLRQEEDEYELHNHDC